METLVRQLVSIPLLTDKYDFSVAFPDRLNRHSQNYLVDETKIIPIKIPRTKNYKLSASEILQVWTSVKKVLLTEKPDLVHLHVYIELTAPVFSICNSLGIPVVHHVHGMLGKKNPRTYLRILKENSLKISVSSAVTQELEAVHRITNVHTIHNGVTDFGINRNEFRQDILLIGRFDWQKGFQDCILAFHTIAREFPESHLHIIGNGPLGYYLKKKAEELGLSDRVTFHGVLSHKEVLEAISNSNHVVVPSLHTEGFGLVAAEAGFVGVPTIASKVGGLTEILTDKETGLLISPGDIESLIASMRILIADKELNTRMGNSARKTVVNKFSMKDFACKIDDVYRRALDVSKL